MRTVLAVIAAFFVGGIFVFLFEMLGHMIYPVPAGMDTGALNNYMRNAAFGPLAAVLLAQSAGSLAGGFVAGLIGRNTISVLIYGVLALIMAALNVFLVSHPIWFVAVSLILPIPVALIGGKIAGMFGGKTEAA